MPIVGNGEIRKSLKENRHPVSPSSRNNHCSHLMTFLSGFSSLNFFYIGDLMLEYKYLSIIIMIIMSFR